MYLETYDHCILTLIHTINESIDSENGHNRAPLETHGLQHRLTGFCSLDHFKIVDFKCRSHKTPVLTSLMAV